MQTDSRFVYTEQRVVESMARGWESKSVEAQIEATMEKSSKRAPSSKQSSRPGSDRSSAQRESLLLARARILKDIATTENNRYREYLQTSLVAIEQQLSEIE
jgi:hypothetical protein